MMLSVDRNMDEPAFRQTTLAEQDERIAFDTNAERGSFQGVAKENPITLAPDAPSSGGTPVGTEEGRQGLAFQDCIHEGRGFYQDQTTRIQGLLGRKGFKKWCAIFAREIGEGITGKRNLVVRGLGLFHIRLFKKDGRHCLTITAGVAA